MDGRWSLLLALGMTLPGPGCLLHREVAPDPPENAPAPAAAPVPPNDPPVAGNVIQRMLGKEPPLRQPKPKTCVALGALKEQNAAEAESAVEREQHLDRALRSYQKAIELDPNQVAAYQGIARVYEALGNYDEAIRSYQQALKKHPKEALLWYDQGMCCARHKDWQSSQQCLRKAVDLEPKNRQYLKTFGFCLARAGQHDESLAYLKKAMSEGEAHLSLARMLHHMNQDAQAREYVQLALQAEPKLTMARQLLDELDAPTAVRAEAPPPDASLLAPPAPPLPPAGQVAEPEPLEVPATDVARFDGRVPDPAQLEGQPINVTPAEEPAQAVEAAESETAERPPGR